MRRARKRSHLPSAPRSGLAMLLGMALVCGPLAGVSTAGAPAQDAGRGGATQNEQDDLARWVNPFVGTKPGGEDHGTGGGAGNTFPGADVPFGMVQWSPDTAKAQHGGYFYDDNRIKGFSLTHLSGAGCSTYQDIPFMPYPGEVTTSPATDPDRYVAGFTHRNEQASPGRYGVRLDNGTRVDLSTTQRTGAGRLRYPAGTPATLLVNTSGSVMGTDDAEVTIGEDSISGWASSGRFCGTDSSYRVYFHAEFDTPFASVGTWKDGVVTPGGTHERGGSRTKLPGNESTSDTTSVAPKDTTVSGPGSGGYVTFQQGAEVNVRVGLSFVSIGGAKSNLRTENANRGVDEVAKAARAEWNKRLNQLRVSGGTDAQRRTFYTALYHSLLQPNVFSDVDGRYIGFDGRIHRAESDHAMYTNFSGWDVYRSEAQLLAMLAPRETADIVRSMIAYAEQGGSWDRWTVANDYTGVMNGDPYHIIVSTAYAFGITDFDAHKALLLMMRGATQPTEGYVERPGLEDYLAKGYAPGAGADTLEYTSADFSIAQLARRLGDSASYQTFSKRAQYWQNLYNPATGYLQPRNADGSFTEPFDPASPTGWTEGNGAQYTWMVPYNVAGLATAFGGNRAAVSRLDTFFTELNAGPKAPYAFLGNEPSMQTPWMYAFLGAAHKTQQITRRAMNELFTPNPDGLVGNDDLGQMSSWYVWAALGMYPEIPGRAELVLNGPLFSKADITTGTGKKITINADGAGTGAPYIQGLRVNGEPSPRPWLPESFARDGGTLDYTMSTEPNPRWGNDPVDAPPSFRDGESTLRGFAEPARLVVPGGDEQRATIGAQDLSGEAGTVRWQAEPPEGITLRPSSGRLEVPGGGKASTGLRVSVAAGTPEGNYRIPVRFTGENPDVATESVLSVLVAEPGSWRTVLNNTGISPDSKPALANFDGGGWSYSAQALAAGGANPGATISVDGLDYTWPDYPAGEADNATAAGQQITMRRDGATRLALLGAAVNGPSSGTLTINYTDGSSQQAKIGFSDWTLGAGDDEPSFGNRTAITSAYRNNASGEPQDVATHVFSTAPIELRAGKRLAGITLPAKTEGGTMHVFGVAAG